MGAAEGVEGRGAVGGCDIADDRHAQIHPALQEDSDRMLFALQKPVAEHKLNGVAVSFTTGPNVVSYDYTVSCYAPVDDISTTDCGAVAAAGLEPISSVTGALPRGYAEVNVEMGLYLNAVVDCLVTVSGGPVDKVTKCQYAPASGPPAAPSTAFVTTYSGNSVVACTIEGTSVSGCGVMEATGDVPFNRPEGIATSGSIAYTVNFAGNSVTACTIEDGTSLTGCVQTGDEFNDPIGIAISGSIAYVVNSGGESVTACTIAGTSLTGCAVMDLTGDGFNYPYGIAISGSTAYVTNFNGYSVTACTISGTSLTGCLATGRTEWDSPTAIAISGSTAYVTNAFDNSVTACNIGGTSLTDCAVMDVTGDGFNFPYGIAVSGSVAYVTNYSNSLTACNISGTSLTDCVASTVPGNPYGIALY